MTSYEAQDTSEVPSLFIEVEDNGSCWNEMNYNYYQLNTVVQLVMCEVTRKNGSGILEIRYNYNKLINPSKYTLILPHSSWEP
jgi:hypothetical protein